MTRVLAWDGCVNVRDLGGLPTVDGGQTRFGAVVRADNVRRLTEDGWRALRGYGVTRIVDLRFVREREDESPPGDDLDVVAVSLFGDHDPADESRVDAAVSAAADGPSAIATLYLDTLERRADRVAAAVEAVAAAPAGAVVVHCFVGKDRTGIVSALMLGVAGVSDAAVIEDYALSGPVVGPLVDDWIAAAENDEERSFRSRISAAPADGLAKVLHAVQERWGGAEGYLLAAGLTAADLHRVRARLV